jgi:hypothetical protein
MTLLLTDEQLKYPDHVGNFVPSREMLDRPQERPSLRALAKLKRSNGVRDELPFIGPENIGKTARDTAPVPGVMFEMIRPDLEFSGTHAATLLIACTQV